MILGIHSGEPRVVITVNPCTECFQLGRQVNFVLDWTILSAENTRNIYDESFSSQFLLDQISLASSGPKAAMCSSSNNIRV